MAYFFVPSRYLRYLIPVTLVGVLAVSMYRESVSVPAPSPSLTEYQKEALVAVKEFTINLLFLATGVFALVGGYLSTEHGKHLRAQNHLLTALYAFAWSTVAGLFVYMALIAQLANGQFDPFGPLLQYCSVIQVLAAGLAAFFLYRFFRANLSQERE